MLAGVMQGGGAGGPPATPAGPPGAGPQGMQQTPAPSHEETIAGLHHFTSVMKPLAKMSKNPQLGKENIQGDILDGIAGLMANGVMSLPEAMNIIRTIPQDPPAQRNWVMQHLRQAGMARDNLLEHYSAAGPDLNAQHGWTKDSHQDHMKGLRARYGIGQGKR